MPLLLVLASIPAMLWGVGSGAPQAGDQLVRAEKNGEFLWKYYPPGALKRGEQGRVAFTLTIEPTGTISGCEVTQGSGFAALDRETCEIMSLYAQVKPPRSSDGRAIRAQQAGFINWKLPPGATRVAAAATSKATSKPDKMICRKDITTGSLISTTKMCMRQSEWERSTEEGKRHWQEMQGKGYTNGNPGGGS